MPFSVKLIFKIKHSGLKVEIIAIEKYLLIWNGVMYIVEDVTA